MALKSWQNHTSLPLLDISRVIARRASLCLLATLQCVQFFTLLFYRVLFYTAFIFVYLSLDIAKKRSFTSHKFSVLYLGYSI